MPRFELDSISLDGKDFQIINKSVKLRLVTQAEAFAYKRQPRGGAVKISNNDVKAIQEALAASNNSRLTTSIVNTNETNGNFIHSDNIASFTGRIFSTSKVGKSLSSQAITKYLQKSFNKLSRRPIYNADQINEESINPSPSPTPPNPDPEPSPTPTPTPDNGGGGSNRSFLLTTTFDATFNTPTYSFSGTATGPITLASVPGIFSSPTYSYSLTFAREGISQLSTYVSVNPDIDITLSPSSNVFDGSNFGGNTGNLTGLRISGSSSNDTIVGSNYFDQITGGPGNDTLTGLSGGNDFTIDAGNDIIEDLGPFDNVAVRAGATLINGKVLADWAPGIAMINENATADTATFTSMAQGVDINLSSVIVGNAGWTVIGADVAGIGEVLSGSSLADNINGMAGDDTITGGAAADSLTGGLGTDSYVYDNAGPNFVDANADTITGFVAGAGANFDILRIIDNANLELAGAATKTFEAANAAAFTAAAGNNVIVITDAVANNTIAGIEAALFAINGANNGAVANGAIIVAAAAAGNAKVWYDTFVGDGVSVELAELDGIVLADLASFVTGNFVVA